MSHHAVVAFPDDDDVTLEKVLRRTRTAKTVKRTVWTVGVAG